jgi:hypothetical protein
MPDNAAPVFPIDPDLMNAVFADLQEKVAKGGCWYRQRGDGVFEKMYGGDHWPATMSKEPKDA